MNDVHDMRRKKRQESDDFERLLLLIKNTSWITDSSGGKKGEEKGLNKYKEALWTERSEPVMSRDCPATHTSLLPNSPHCENLGTSFPSYLDRTEE